MENEVGLKPLMDCVLREIVVAGDRGVTIAEFLALIDNFHNHVDKRNSSHLDTTSKGTGNASYRSTRVGDFENNSSEKVDFQSKVKAWDSLRILPNVRIGDNGTGNDLTLRQILDLPPAINAPGVVSKHNAEGDLGPPNEQCVIPDSVGNIAASLSTGKNNQPRIYVTEIQRATQDIAVDSPDRLECSSRSQPVNDGLSTAETGATPNHRRSGRTRPSLAARHYAQAENDSVSQLELDIHRSIVAPIAINRRELHPQSSSHTKGTRNSSNFQQPNDSQSPAQPNAIQSAPKKRGPGRPAKKSRFSRSTNRIEDPVNESTSQLLNDCTTASVVPKGRVHSPKLASLIDDHNISSIVPFIDGFQTTVATAAADIEAKNTSTTELIGDFQSTGEPTVVLLTPRKGSGFSATPFIDLGIPLAPSPAVALSSRKSKRPHKPCHNETSMRSLASVNSEKIPQKEEGLPKAVFTSYDDYMREDGIPGVYFNVSGILRHEKAARKKYYRLAIFKSEKLKEIPWMQSQSGTEVTSDKTGFANGSNFSSSTSLGEIVDADTISQDQLRHPSATSDKVSDGIVVETFANSSTPAEAIVPAGKSLKYPICVLASANPFTVGVNVDKPLTSLTATESHAQNAGFQTSFQSDATQSYDLNSVSAYQSPFMPSTSTTYASPYASPYPSPFASRYQSTPGGEIANADNPTFKSRYAPATPSEINSQRVLHVGLTSSLVIVPASEPLNNPTSAILSLCDQEMGKHPSQKQSAQEKAADEKMAQEKVDDKRFYTSIRAAEAEAPINSSHLLTCSTDGVGGTLFLTEDKAHLKFIRVGGQLESPTLVLSVSKMTVPPTTSDLGSKPMELQIRNGDIDNPSAVTHHFRFLETEEAFQAANNLRAKLVTAMTLLQLEKDGVVPRSHVKPIKTDKPFKCPTCTLSWKNIEGLKYHKSKARTTCNPNWDGKAKGSTRVPKPKLVENGLNTDEKEKTDAREEIEKVLGHGPVSESFKTPQPRAAKSITSLNPLASASRPIHQADRVGKLQPIPATKVQTKSRSAESGPAHSPASPLGPRPQSVTTGHEGSSTEHNMSALPKERRRIAQHPSYGDPQRQKNIIKSLLEANGGVFSADEGLWFALVAAWVRDFPHSRYPDKKACLEAVQLLEDDGSITKHQFSFKDIIGVMQTRNFITENEVGPFDLKCIETKQKIKNSYPDPYVPIGFAPPEDVRSKLEGRSTRARGFGISFSDHSGLLDKQSIFGDDIDSPNDELQENSRKPRKFNGHKHNQNNGFSESNLLGDKSDGDRRYGRGSERHRKLRAWSAETREKQSRKMKEYWNGVRATAGKSLSTETSDYSSPELRERQYSLVSTSDPGSPKLQAGQKDQRKSDNIQDSISTAWSGSWKTSGGTFQNPETGAWNQKEIPYFLKRNFCNKWSKGFSEPITYMQSSNGAWNMRPFGHGVKPIYARPSRRKDVDSAYVMSTHSGFRPVSYPKMNSLHGSSLSSQFAVFTQSLAATPSTGRKRKLRVSSKIPHSEHNIDNPIQLEGFVSVEDMPQSERTKRRYLRSDLYSKKRTATQTTQPEEIREQSQTPKPDRQQRKYTKRSSFIPLDEINLEDETRPPAHSRRRYTYRKTKPKLLEELTQTAVFSRDFFNRQQSLKNGYPEVTFLAPNTQLFESTNGKDQNLENVEAGKLFHTAKQPTDDNVSESLVVQFQKPKILRNDQDTWKDLPDSWFEEGSFSLQGSYPSAEYILRGHLPSQVEDINSSDSILKAQIMAQELRDPQYAKFLAEIAQVADWEQNVAKDVLQIGTVAPNHIFFTHTIASLQRTEVATEVSFEWLDLFAFTIESIPYDELEQDESAVAKSPPPPWASKRRGRKRKYKMDQNKQSHEVHGKEFNDDYKSDGSKRYPKRRKNKVSYTVSPEYFQDQEDQDENVSGLDPTIGEDEGQDFDFQDDYDDLRDPKFKAGPLQDDEVNDQEFEDEGIRYLKRSYSQQGDFRGYSGLKRLNTSRHQVALQSDLTGLLNFSSKPQDIAVEVADLASQSFVGRRKRFIEQQNLSHMHDSRIMVAVVAIRTLTGGVNSLIDWILVTKQFPLHNLSSIEARWKILEKKHKAIIEKFTLEFQDMFLLAYQRNEVPSIDYDHLLDYDWKKLIDWVMERIDSVDSFVQIVSRLPDSRDNFNDRFEITDDLASQKVPFWRDEWFHVPKSVHVRMEGSSSVQFTNPIENAAIPVEDLDDLTIAKSWLRASVLTPNSAYDVDATKKKMAQISRRLVSTALDILVLTKVIAAKYKGRPGPGRGYDVSDIFTSALRKPLQEKHFTQAATFKAHLDAKFRAKEDVTIEWTAEDGVIMAITNLQAHGRIKLEGRDIPIQRFGLLPKGNYQTKMLPKEQLHFEIEILPTDTYLHDSDLEILQKLPLLAYDPPRGTRHAIPVWYDISERLLPVMWSKVLAAVMGTMAMRPGMPVVELKRVFAPAMEQWEIRCLIDWCVRTGALVEITGGHEGWNMGEWWWLVVGRCVDGS